MKKILVIALLSTMAHGARDVFIPPYVPLFSNQSMDENSRPSSLPYISGDTFRAFAKFKFDELRLPLDINKINNGDTIFVKTDLIEHFFTVVHPSIKSKYILITHNSDYSAPGKFAHMLDDEKLIAWFAQNCDLQNHLKLIPIPIGIANPYWSHGNTAVIRTALKKIPKIKKERLIYFNCSATNNARNEVYDYFNGQKFCSQAPRKPWNEYLLEMARSKFVISPRGNGLDCHRTWEALLMGSFPIVKTSTLDKLYEGLPVWIVTEWSEVTEESLHKKYLEFSSNNYTSEKIYADYWLNLISNAAKHI